MLKSSKEQSSLYRIAVTMPMSPVVMKPTTHRHPNESAEFDDEETLTEKHEQAGQTRLGKLT